MKRWEDIIDAENCRVLINGDWATFEFIQELHEKIGEAVKEHLKKEEATAHLEKL